MPEITRDEVRRNIIVLLQQLGITTEHTYDLVDAAINSVQVFDEDDEDEPTYHIVRFYQRDHPREVVETGLTLEEAKAHCKDPEASSSTCSTSEGLERTRKYGNWFDGYEEE